MELVRDGSLTDLLRKRRKERKDQPFSHEEASVIMKCLLEAMSYIHQRGIVHRDLKLDNLLVDNEEDLKSLKLADFGLSGKLDQGAQGSHSLFSNCGTLVYMSPEILRNRPYSKPVDIWSSGIIMYALLTGKHPLYDPKDTKETLLQKILNPSWKFPHESFNSLSKDLFLKLVQVEPSKRYTASQAAMHPWITHEFHAIVPLTLNEICRLFPTKNHMKSGLCVLVLTEFIRNHSSNITAKHNEINLTDSIEIVDDQDQVIETESKGNSSNFRSLEGKGLHLRIKHGRSSHCNESNDKHFSTNSPLQCNFRSLQQSFLGSNETNHSSIGSTSGKFALGHGHSGTQVGSAHEISLKNVFLEKEKCVKNKSFIQPRQKRNQKTNGKEESYKENSGSLNRNEFEMDRGPLVLPEVSLRHNSGMIKWVPVSNKDIVNQEKFSETTQGNQDSGEKRIDGRNVVQKNQNRISLQAFHRTNKRVSDLHCENRDEIALRSFEGTRGSSHLNEIHSKPQDNFCHDPSSKKIPSRNLPRHPNHPKEARINFISRLVPPKNSFSFQVNPFYLRND